MGFFYLNISNCHSFIFFKISFALRLSVKNNKMDIVSLQIQKLHLAYENKITLTAIIS